MRMERERPSYDVASTVRERDGWRGEKLEGRMVLNNYLNYLPD